MLNFLILIFALNYWVFNYYDCILLNNILVFLDLFIKQSCCCLHSRLILNLEFLYFNWLSFF